MTVELRGSQLPQVETGGLGPIKNGLHNVAQKLIGLVGRDSGGKTTQIKSAETDNGGGVHVNKGPSSEIVELAEGVRKQRKSSVATTRSPDVMNASLRLGAKKGSRSRPPLTSGQKFFQPGSDFLTIKGIETYRRRVK